MAGNPLKELNKLGQSVWHDYIARGELLNGELKRRIEEDGVTGVTSNPSIFEKAILGSKDYDDDFRKLVQQGLEGPQIFESLAVKDIQTACDLFRPIYERTQGRDGFVSLEVSPFLAHETQAQLDEARRLFHSVNRPNVMIKIPGTIEGLPAIEAALGEGLNINITLIFSVERYEKVASAYLNALEKLDREGKPINRIASVASVFVSRIDTLADKLLETKLQAARSDAERRKIEGLMGKVAVANTKIIYQKFKEIFRSARFQALAAKGARVQRPLWGSTSTKNPKYSDVLYVATLIGPDTVNTLPTVTMDAFRDHGVARVTIEEDLDGARRVLKELGEVGIDLNKITQKVEDEGVALFARDFEKLMKCIEEKRALILAGPRDRTTANLGSLQKSVDDTLGKLQKQDFSSRLWKRDPSLWKTEPEHQEIIKNALGWLTIPQAMLEQLQTLSTFVEEVKREGYRHAVVLGMGGSSLCPDVCRATFGTAPGFLQLHVLDSTVPEDVKRLEESIDLGRTLFLVSSKSGGTIEPLSFFKYFYQKVEILKKGNRPGQNFVAITDPGTPLEKLAREHGFRDVFYGRPDIGGRYSALSNFGIVPAALAGVDVRRMLERAQRMVHACASCIPAAENPGVTLGAILAKAGEAGRSKITLVASPEIATFGDWAEQLIAESTGKEGKGLVPVTGEELGSPEVYGTDRQFVHLKLAGGADGEDLLKNIESAGHPVVRIELQDKLDLGQEFFRWEIATATAGALLGIDPFDQPNVKESKDNTNRLLSEFRSRGALPGVTPVLAEGDLQFYCDPATRAELTKHMQKERRSRITIEDYAAVFLEGSNAGEYVALMAYLARSEAIASMLDSIRIRLRDSLRLATTLGYGPRFLHSTGQLHKGGPNKALFIQITADDAEDLPIPGEPYSFSVLRNAQALGDLQSLESKQRRVVRFHLGRDVLGGLKRLSGIVESALDRVHAVGTRA